MDRRMGVWRERRLVPYLLLEKIYQKYSNEDQPLQECADYFVNCYYDPSWSDLCKGLFDREEMTAARKAKTFIPQTGE